MEASASDTLLGAKRPSSDDGLSQPSGKVSRVDGASSVGSSCAVIKGSWSPEEDAVMRAAVAEFGLDWKQVASRVTGRTSKQCRDRYKLKLDPTINHGPFTAQEDARLTQLQEQLGRQWTKIAALMPGRTENSVKSRFASLDRSRKREWTDEEDRQLRECRARDMTFTEIAEQALAPRSEHAIKRRWERLFMRDLARRIKNEMPRGGPATLADDPAPSAPPAHAHAPAAEPAPLHAPKLERSQSFPVHSQAPFPFPSAPAHRGPAAFANAHVPSSSAHAGRLQRHSTSVELFGLSDGDEVRVHVPAQQPPHALSSAIDSLLVHGGAQENLSRLRKRLSCESAASQQSQGSFWGRSSVGSASMPFQFLYQTHNRNELGGEASQYHLDINDINNMTSDHGVDAPPRMSHRSGNLKRQSTSVTILQQLLAEPL